MNVAKKPPVWKRFDPSVRSGISVLKPKSGAQRQRAVTANEPLPQRVRKRIGAILDYYLFRYIVIGAVALLTIWMLLKLFFYFTSFVAPTHQLVLVPYDAADNSGKEAVQIFSSKLRRMKASVEREPSGYGFLEVPALASTPQEVQKAWQNLDNLKDINIKIKDVDVNAVVKAIREVLSPPQYELRVRVMSLPEATEVSCDLVYADKQQGNWSSRVRKPAAAAGGNAGGGGGGGAQAQSANLDALLDDVLFQMIYDFMTNDKYKGWGIKMNEEGFRPKNWQTLQAYVRGIQALAAYQQNLDHRDLQDSLEFLKRLPIVAPDNPYGLYFYGIALSEDRQEAQAVAVFEQLERLVSETPAGPEPSATATTTAAATPLATATDTATASSTASPDASPGASQTPPPGTSTAETESSASNSSASNASSSNVSASNTSASNSSASNTSPSGTPAGTPSPAVTPTPVKQEEAEPQAIRPIPKDKYKRMYYEAVFNEATARLKLYKREPGEQAARDLNYLIAALGEERQKATRADDKCYYSKLLATSYAQLAYTHGTILSFLYDHYGKPSDPLPQDVADNWSAVQETLRRAKEVFKNDLANCWKASETEEQAQLDREKNDIEFRIKNAEGYSTFRRAQFMVNDTQFKQSCLDSIRILEQANLARANHYEALQNMAMIYEDERFDGKGNYLDRAESLYLLTMQFVPNDYYQYEHMAQIQWRRIKLAEPTESTGLIKKGKEYAEKAVEKRQESPRALHLLALFNVKTWRNAQTKKTADAASAAEAISYFKRAVAIRSEYSGEYVNFLIAVADSGAKDAKTSLEAGKALIELAKTEFANNTAEKKRLLERAIQLLDKALQLITGKTDDESKKISEEATKLRAEATTLSAAS